MEIKTEIGNVYINIRETSRTDNEGFPKYDIQIGNDYIQVTLVEWKAIGEFIDNSMQFIIDNKS